MSREIVLVSGNLCSGKSHFCSSHYPTYTRIGVSDVVRSLSNAADRLELSKTAHLDQQIATELINQITQHNKVIVDGIRQLSILKAIEEHFGPQIKAVVWLDVSEDVLKTRYNQRASAKDKTMTFEQAIQSDKDLGIGDVEHYIKVNHKTLHFT